MTKVLTCISRVRPSGAARATYWLPMAPEAPGRFSTTTLWPSAVASTGAARRAMMSMPVPGVKGAMMVMGPSCAKAGAARGESSKARRSMGFLPEPG